MSVPADQQGCMPSQPCESNMRLCVLIVMTPSFPRLTRPPSTNKVRASDWTGEASQHELADVFQFGMGVAGMFSAGWPAPMTALHRICLEACTCLHQCIAISAAKHGSTAQGSGVPGCLGP
eukprot:scaffold141299_cov19-Tisochrysis_lutea.AAC.3